MPHHSQMPRAPRGALLGALLGATLALHPSTTRAQEQAGPSAGAGSITGTVRDAAGAVVEGAEVFVVGTLVHTLVDARGSFHVEGVRGSPVVLRVRRIGFRPYEQPVAMPATEGATVAVTLTRLAQELAPVVVEARRDMRMRQLQGFYDRKKVGIGRFITRDQIDARNASTFADLIRGFIPGAHITSSRASQNAVRFRSNTCAPLVWLDGTPATAGELDLDAIAPSTVMAVEVYSGIASVPSEFRTPRGTETCGVIAIWSGIPPRPPRQRKGDVKKILDSLSAASAVAPRIYSADEVETPAQVDSSELARPLYPDSLYARGATGEAVVQFVVDPNGLVEPESFGVVSATHPQFAESARRALIASRFHPAMLKGTRVRQVMVMPFRFVLQNDEP